MQTSSGNLDELLRFKPVFNVALYKAEINVTGNYLSGLLLIKKMPDSSTRLVFSNEMGLKFFDFEFQRTGEFKVHYILKKMDRKAVIKTLRKDFDLVLMHGIERKKYKNLPASSGKQYAFQMEKGFNHYMLDSTQHGLLRMERRSNTGKAVVSAMAARYEQNLPDTIGITHHNFNFSIGLKKMER